MDSEPTTGKPAAAKPAEPPGDGRTDQHTMRAAAHQPIQGPASSDRLAAGGGLDVPGDHDVNRGSDLAGENLEAESLIPGARESNTLTHREAGAIGGQFSGADIPGAQSDWLDDKTAAEHYREGGGRLPRKTRTPNVDGKRKMSD